jgi:signal transduction histidine kinase
LDHWDALSDSERRDTIGRAAFNAQRLQALTRDVLDVSSAERGDIRYAFGPVDLREGVDAAVAATRESQPERTITVTAPDGRLWVRGDVDRLLQVLLNLLDNAITSSPAGSPIEVVAQPTGDQIEVSVTDHGAGLAEGEVDTIFDKFVRGRASGIRGTGLGLFLCRQIVEAHGGRIWAEADSGGGAKLRFTVPRTADVPEPEPPTTVSASAD